MQAQAAQAHGSDAVDTVAQVAVDHGATFAYDGGMLHVGPATAPAAGKAPACFHCGTRCPHAVVRVVESPTMVGNLCTACVGDWYVPHVSAQGDGTWCYRVPGAERMQAGAPIAPDADNACADAERAQARAELDADAEQVECHGCDDTGTAPVSGLPCASCRPAESLAAIEARDALETARLLHADAVQALQAAGAAASVAIVGTNVPHVAVLCGDGAPAVVDALAQAGIDTTAGTLSVHRYCVGCSAHLTGDAEQGTDAPRLYRGARVRMAIDTNGQRDTVARIVRAHGGTVTDATGVFGGDALPSVVADVDADMVTSIHVALRAMVDGYGCAAVLSARQA